MNFKKSKPNMVNILVRDNLNKILLIHNIGKSGKDDRWEMPGGKVNNGVPLEEMAKKEASQELGIDVEIQGIFGDYETRSPEGDFLCRTYFAEIIEGHPTIKEEKHDEVDYFDYNSLLKLESKGVLVPNLRLALPKLKNYLK
jgi:ADP-ribose pyrophosphatase YjhB (NUDIX family)